ncbi:10 TMS drug/metabolite exporter EamA [Salmonella bongori]|nr:10 TMS drug/metabolite exporter EamA [Salmonella bongori]
MSKRRLRWGYAFSALLAVIGAGIIRYDRVTDHFWIGLLLVQLSNISFAIGMVGYKRLMETRPMPQHNAFAWFYLGAFFGGGGGVVAVGECAENTGNNPAVEHSDLPWRGGVRHWLLYVELWRHSGGCRDVGHYEQYACSCGTAG